VALSRAEARRRALEANPAIAGALAGVAAADGAWRQARAFANPELAVEVEDFGGTLPHDAPVQTTVGIVQSVEWFSKRAARVEAADAARRVAALDAVAARRDVAAEVDRRFAALVGAQERLAIARENAGTAREVTAAVAALAGAGEVSAIEEVRARGDEGLAAIDLAGAERDLELARRALAELWGDAGAEVGTAVREPESDQDVPGREGVLAAVGGLPDLARWEAEIAVQEALLARARRQALPDVAVSVGSRSWSGSGARGFVAGVALPIPLLTQHGGARAEAAARLEQARHARRAAEARTRAAAAAAHERLLRAREEARRLREEVAPGAEEVYAALGEGYRRGKLPLIDLLEARRALAAIRLRVVEAETGVAVAAADLRRLTADGDEAEKGSRR